MKAETEQKRLPYPVIHALLTDPAFTDIIGRCLEEEDLIAGFCRIYEVELPQQPKNGLEAMIDEATGYRNGQYLQFFSQFIPFVHRTVYLPLKVQFETSEKGEKA